jgi:hypothetical protein
MAKTKDILYKVNDTGCHICISHKPNIWGYIQMTIKGKKILMHRYFYMQKFGPIKEDNVIRHTCDNRLCINIEHLIEGTKYDNIQDRNDRGRTAKGITNGLSKLTEKEVLEIFTNTIDSHSELGRKYKISYNTIIAIRTGRTWKHITSKLLG